MIHKTAIVEEGAQLGDNVKIWHFTHVMGTAKIGNDVTIGARCWIGPNVIIGDGCKIQNGVTIPDGVVLEKDVFVGPNVSFTNVRYPRAYINQRDNFQKTLVKNGATLGGNSSILCGIIIGEFSFIAMGACVFRDVPDKVTVLGNPAIIIDNARVNP